MRSAQVTAKDTHTHTPNSQGPSLMKGTQVGCEAGSSGSNCCPGPFPGSCFPEQLSYHLSGCPNPPLGTKGPQRSGICPFQFHRREAEAELRPWSPDTALGSILPGTNVSLSKAPRALATPRNACPAPPILSPCLPTSMHLSDSSHSPAQADTTSKFKGFNRPSVLSSTHLSFQLDLCIHTTHLG